MSPRSIVHVLGGVVFVALEDEVRELCLRLASLANRQMAVTKLGSQLFDLVDDGHFRLLGCQSSEGDEAPPAGGAPCGD